MEITCRTIREYARRSLKGKWTVAFLCTLLCGNFSFIGGFVPNKFYLSTIFIILLLASGVLFRFGYNDIILKITRSSNVEFSNFFSGYKRALKALGMIILIELYSFLWSLLFMIPGIVARIKYSMAYFIWVDNPDIGINEAIEQSINITDGYKWKIFKLYLSFIGWYLLIAIPFFAIMYYTDLFRKSNLLTKNCVMSIAAIGSLYLYTYGKTSMGVLYNKLKKREN